MKFQIGAMSVGDILDRGLRLLLVRLPMFYCINLIVLVPTLVYGLALPYMIVGRATGAFVGASLLALLLAIVLNSVASAAILYVVAQEFVDQRVSLGEAFTFAFRRFLRIFLASLIYGLVLFLGLACLIIPGIFIAVFFAFVLPVVVVENLGVFQAFNRSQELTAGYRWYVLGVLVLLVLILLVATIIQNVLQRLFPGFEVIQTQAGPQAVLSSYASYVAAMVFGFLLNTLVGVYYSVCLTLLYFDLRIRKEGFDLELAARQQLRPNP